MKWNPVFNAVAALAYIGGVALFMNFITAVRHDTPDTLLDVVGVLSLLTFSAAMMAFLFFYRPVALLIEHKKTEAVAYFLKTLGIFGLLTIAVLVLVSVQ